MIDFFDLVIELVAHTKIRWRGLILLGIALVGLGVIVLVIDGLSGSSSATVLWGGVVLLIMGGTMVVVGIYRWSVQDHLK